MSNICTYTGRKVNLIQTEDMDIDYQDIAHALSLNCRFNGHTNTMWTVASHSVLVSDMLYGEFKDSKLALVGLMHDASECYISDISRPLKEVLPSYTPIEMQIQDRIYKHLGLLDYVRDADVQMKLKEYDDLALQAEALKLMEPFEEWGEYLNKDKERAEKWMHRVKVQNPQIVKGAYLMRIYEHMKRVDMGNEFVTEYTNIMEEALRRKAVPIFERKELFGFLEFGSKDYMMKRGGKLLSFPKSLMDNSMSVSLIID